MNSKHRKAQQIATLCTLWLTHNKEDITQAKYTTPYLLPRSYPDAKEVNAAIREAWVPSWQWDQVFQAWQERKLEDALRRMENDKPMDQGELL